MQQYSSFAKMLLKGQSIKLTALLLLQILSGVGPIMLAWVNGGLIDQLSVNQDLLALKVIMIFVILSSFLISMEELFSVLHNLCGEYFQDLVYKRVQFKFLEAIALEPSNRMFEDAEENNRISIVKQSVHSLSDCIGVLTQVISVIFGLISALALGVTIAWWIPVVLLASLGPFIYFRTSIENSIWAAKETHAHIFNKLNLYERILTLPDFAKDIRMYNMQPVILLRWKNLYGKFFSYINNVRTRSSWILSFWALISGLGPLVTFWYVANSAMQGNLSLGKVSFLLGIIIQLRGSITCLLYNSADIFRVLLTVKPLLALIYKHKEEASEIKPPFSNKQTVIAKEALLRFENVNFSYPGSTELVIKNLSFTLNVNKSIAIVGENGSGKSTLLKLICRLYEPTSGTIYWQGKDICKIPINTYRQQLSVLFQDFAKFPLSVRENSDPHAAYETSEVKQVLHEVELDFLNDKLDVSLSKTMEGGIDLSGGQWQRLAMTRLILDAKNTSLLLLDEPTSALDPNTEHKILILLNTTIQSKSALIISHRLALCRFVSKIIVMQQGELIEEGTHQELMSCDTEYKTMFLKQAAWYIETGNA